MDYKQAGVDVVAGDALVEWLKATQPRTFPHQDKLVSGIGGFAALFRADFRAMKDPCLVSCTDGVGTKVKLAAEFGRYREVAQDLVAMCVNDLICCGAQPLFFLDYYATGRLVLGAAQDFLDGVRSACIASDCALIGGETAEMPGVYDGKDFDCAGFAVGVVDRAVALGPERVQVGDVIVGLASSGFHSNGYSLLRRVFAQDLSQWADILLRPTALYVKVAQALIAAGGVRAIAHITGGGLDNLPRVLPENTVAELTPWPIPEIFLEVQRRTGLPWSEMVRTLNCGMGLMVVAAAEDGDRLLETSRQHGFSAQVIGQIITGQGEPHWRLANGRDWREAVP